MGKLPRVARVYVTIVILAGAALLGFCLPHIHIAQPVLFAMLLVIASATAFFNVRLPLTNSTSTMSVSYAVNFLALLIFDPHVSTLVALAAAFCQQNFVNRKDRVVLFRQLFNMASFVITVEGAGFAYHLLGGTTPATVTTTLARPLVGAATVYFLLNTGLVANAIALSERESFTNTWHSNFLWSAPNYFVGAGLAALAAWLIEHTGYWVAPLTLAPLYLTYRTYKVYLGRIEDEQRHALQTSELHLATIEALARAIDAKDQTTQMHIRRVQLYAVGLAEAAGLSEFDIQGVKTAALLHDIGKLAVPEHILSKPGPLTQEEFQKIRIHPQIGAEIIAAVPFPYPVAPLILSHHERWDGKGYPHGLAAEDIPIGSRILTLVDYYDAVTSDRPYHKALSHEGAIGLLRHEAGRALDPTLVPMFIDLLPSLIAQLENSGPAKSLTLPEEAGAGTTAVGLIPSSVGNAFENIALAHREIYALYEIAQSMGTSLGVSDTMALISSKISKIIPWSGCTLFLYQAETETLKCRFAAGVDTPRLLNTTLRVGEGLAGWVARNRRTLINADPRVTFEAAGVQDDTRLRSAIVCPLFYSDTFIGCLALYHTDPNRYTEDHHRLLDRIAEQAGAVILNSIVFEQTQEDSLTDPLTGLPNRRSMFLHLSRELARAERLKGEVGVIVMDVDGFKAINDTYGHHIGDHALRAIAAAVQCTLRPYDLCVRYAGDEFIVVLTDCSPASVEHKRQELQRCVEQVEIEARPGKTLRLAVSAGASVFPHDGGNYEALLADADQRMYRDKAARHGMLMLSHARTDGIAGSDDLEPLAPEPGALPLPHNLIV
jgi:diguanylate cyclase (GGDEF)-like protein/putative nucleotidyltransferase with HDIG domain